MAKGIEEQLAERTAALRSAERATAKARRDLYGVVRSAIEEHRVEKIEVHRLTGLSRDTIDRLLREGAK